MSNNGFIFPFASMSFTLLDITTITSFPVKGKEISTLFSLFVEDLGIQFSKSSASYLAFLTDNTKNKGPISDREHHVFLFFWFCKYFIYTNSIAIVSEYSYYMETIISSKPLALALSFFFIFAI